MSFLRAAVRDSNGTTKDILQNLGRKIWVSSVTSWPHKARVVFRVSGLLKKAHQEFERMKSDLSPRCRGVSKRGTSVRRAKKKVADFAPPRWTYPNPGTEKNGWFLYASRKSGKKPAKFEMPISGTKFSPGVLSNWRGARQPAWNLPFDVANIHLLVWFFWPKRSANNKLLFFFFFWTLSKFSYMVSCNFWGLKTHDYFDSEFAYDVMRKAGVAEVLVRSMRLGFDFW